MKKHPYILATIIATLLASVVWLCVPKEYRAVTKISDEYKEMDLSIGMSMIKAQIKASFGSSNNGLDNIEVYCKTLSTEDFAEAIGHKQVAGKQMTYADYVGAPDTIKAIQNRIEYDCSSRQATLTIAFTDSDPEVASQMLDSVTAHLQAIVTNRRLQLAEAILQDTKKRLKLAEDDYKKRIHDYDTFAEANANPQNQQVKQKLLSLEKEIGTSYKNFEEAGIAYVRQLALKQRSYMSFAVIQSNTVSTQDNRNFPLYFFSILILLFLLTRAAQLYQEKRKTGWNKDLGDIFSPWNLTIFIWMADIALYFIQGTMDPIGPKFIQCFTVWLATMIPASLAAYMLTAKQTHHTAVDYKTPLDVPMTLFNVLCVIAGLLTLTYAIRIWGIVSMFDLDNLLFNLRLYIVEDNSVTGLLNHVQGLNFALFVVGIWLYPKISKWQMTYIVLVNLIFEIFRMEKSGILIMILGTLFLLYQRQSIKKRTILLTMAGIVVLFFFFNLSKEDVDSKQETTFLDFFGMYITSPMVAFDHLYPDLTGHFGENTFCIIYPYLNMLGFDLEYTNRLQEFVWVPIATNVYTIMQPFYNDFGVMGIGFFGIIYGSFFGWTYRRFREGDPVFICIYTYLIEVILIQFYNDNLLQNIVLFMEFCFFVYILTQKKYRLSFYHHEQTAEAYPV